MRSPAYWIKRLQEPERFHETVTMLLDAGVESYIEVGVGLGLLISVGEVADTKRVALYPSFPLHCSALGPLRCCLRELYVNGVLFPTPGALPSPSVNRQGGGPYYFPREIFSASAPAFDASVLF